MEEEIKALVELGYTNPQLCNKYPQIPKHIILEMARKQRKKQSIEKGLTRRNELEIYELKIGDTIGKYEVVNIYNEGIRRQVECIYNIKGNKIRERFFLQDLI